MHMGRIRVGIGGWTFAPWRGTFYPPGLPQKRELEHASRQLTTIEINGTYYGRQKPESFAAWAQVAPDDFVFTVKGSRFVTNRKKLAEAGESVANFVAQGIVELGPKLGPILWQLPHTKKFDADDIAAFFALLPAAHEGVPLRHAIQARHDSFRDPAFVALACAAGVAIVYAHSPTYPELADVTADFVYARLETGTDEEPTGYPPAEIARWADACRTWARGGQPEQLTYATPEPAPVRPRDVFAFFIHGGKVRAPAAARALMTRMAD